jgi:hypothetical protein
MRITKRVLAGLAVLAVFTLTSRSARAGDMNCATVAACSFGTAIATDMGTTTGTGHNASYTETVYQNGSVFTYLFTISDTTGPTLDYASTFTNSSSGSIDNFNCGNGSCLNYGVINGLSTVNGTGFTFMDFSLQVGIKQLGNGGTFAFYAQSGEGPTAGQIYVGDGGPTTPVGSLDPAYEPSVLTLLGSLLLLLLLGKPFASILRTRTA